MTPNQWKGFILAVLGFAPCATAGPGVVHHSDHHYMLIVCFLLGLLGFGLLIGGYRK